MSEDNYEAIKAETEKAIREGRLKDSEAVRADLRRREIRRDYERARQREGKK